MRGGDALARTFLFTDIEGSTRLWEDDAPLMRSALARHDQLLTDLIRENGGQVFSIGGDGFGAAFSSASAALRVAIQGQLSLVHEPWPTSRPVKTRMGLHTDLADSRGDNFFGPGVNRCARLMSAAHGGQILCSGATAALIRSALGDGIRLTDLGEHRLRDLAYPLRVYQLEHPRLPAQFPPLRSLDAYPSNLPAQLATFIGRGDDLADVRDALRACRLVTLTGVGGVGKTRLALQVAADVLPNYADGSWLVELGGVADAAAVEEAIAAALCVQEQPGQTLRESVLGYLRGKHLLMVLDNCEHLLEPIAELVATALSRAPHLTVLATSREALGVGGEQVVGVRSLPVPASDRDPGDLVASDAVALFVDRARAARDDFALNAENHAAIAHLCRRLDGIPLAIELAAARVRSMAPAEIAVRLDQRFRLLTGGARRAANRHQTLRRAIDWSWDLLTEDERALLRRLAVCVGGFDLAGAEAIGAGSVIDSFDVDDLLGRLVEKSLVVAEDRGHTMRYRMLETIREYALERLEESGEMAEARERHAQHYAEFAEQACAGLKSSDEREWLVRTDAELDNLRLAVAWSSEAGQSSLAMRIVAALSLHGLRIETSVGAWADAAVRADGARHDPRYPAALACVAWAAMRQGNLDRALALTREALALSSSDSVDSARIRAHVITTSSGILGSLQQTESSALVDEWIAIAESLDDPYMQTLAYAIRCVTRHFNGDDGAIEAGEHALACARRSGSPTAISYALLVLSLAIDTTDPERSIAMLEEAVEQADSVENRYSVSVAGQTRGTLLTRVGDFAGGLHATVDSADRAWRVGHRLQQAQSLWWAAGVLAMMERDEPAATIEGWVRSVYDWRAGAPSNALELNDALRAVAARLGDEKYAELTARGAAMDDDAVMEYAHAAASTALFA